MTRRAYQTDPSVDPTSLPWAFDTDVRAIDVPDNTGYVEVDGSLPGGTEVPLRPRPAEVVLVPQTVSRAQGMIALSRAGLLASIEGLISQADPETQLAWATIQEFHRNSPLLLSLAGVMGMTDAQIDSLFIAASQIVI